METMTATTTPPPFDLAEPIPGYRVQTRVGAGGNGEVWKVEARGGIAKALKVVYGHRDDERAVRELNALNRIKEVRHPFLLSIERIEVVDGHLIIITELAESNLMERFGQCRESGLPGIPRGELLGHLHDAADALDYICQKHSLQHLDVKPENLLLVGGRIKVADFGLVKDLQDVHSSIVGGLTPVYAAPELFDGRPDMHSDQYSLAIVYQHMLTGTLPYEGRTTAQLAAQHLHCQPRLDRLPASDQGAIARALAKEPHNRFSSCRDLIDSLIEVTPGRAVRAGRSLPRTNHVAAASPSHGDTEVISPAAIHKVSAAETAAQHKTQDWESPEQVRDLPPIPLAAEATDYRPAVFIGVGGIAARALQVLRRRLNDRFGDLAAVPAVQMLLFDTDAETLKVVTRDDPSHALDEDSTILLPLRSTADYRREPAARLQWLSRRWIYNIPRSLQTQGLRPLGRLAMVDRMELVMERIEHAIRMAVDPAGIAASALATGLPFHAAPPRIFIVASIAGGTGSGMALDFGYVVRKVLRDLGLSEECLCGVLAHGIGRGLGNRDLSVAGAYAMLGELQHYADPQHGYPGDPACGLPAFAPQDPPFSHTYVVHLGEDLDAKDFAAGVDGLAQYLYCNTVTAAAAFFDRCRAAQQGAGTTVRTFAFRNFGLGDDAVPAWAIDEVCRTLVTRWRGADRAEPGDSLALLSDPAALLTRQMAGNAFRDNPRSEVAAQIEAAELGLEQVVGRLATAAARELGNSPESYLAAVLSQLRQGPASDDAPPELPPAQVVLGILDSLVNPQGTNEHRGVCLEASLEKYVKELAAAQGTSLQQWILGLAVSPKHCVLGAQRSCELVADHLRAVGREAGDRLTALLPAIRAIKESLLASKTGSRDWLRFDSTGPRREPVVDPRLAEYFHARIEEATLGAVRRWSGGVLTHLSVAADKLRRLAADLKQLADRFPQRPPAAGQGGSAGDAALIGRLMSETLQHRKAELVAALDRAVQDDLHRAVAEDKSLLRGDLANRLGRMTRAALLSLVKSMAVREIAAAPNGGPSEPAWLVGGVAAAAADRLSACGGARRLLLVAPNDVSPGPLLARLCPDVHAEPTVVRDTHDNMFVCQEVEQLSLRRVAATVLDGRFQNVEIASRLHTRTDVDWSPL